MIQAARLHLNDRFAGAGLRIRHLPQFKFSRRAVRDKLKGFHGGEFNAKTRSGKGAKEFEQNEENKADYFFE